MPNYQPTGGRKPRGPRGSCLLVPRWTVCDRKQQDQQRLINFADLKNYIKTGSALYSTNEDIFSADYSSFLPSATSKVGTNIVRSRTWPAVLVALSVNSTGIHRFAEA